MAKKSKTPKTEEAPLEEVAEIAPVEEVAPVKEIKKATPKATKKSGKVGLEHMPSDTDLPDLKDYINASYMAALGRAPTELEMNHHLHSVEVIGFPRNDVQTEIKRSGEYQGLHGL